MAEVEIAYLAGLFDGEGCLIVRPRRRLASGNRAISYHLEIGMTDARPLEWAKEATGKGCLYHSRNKNPKWSDRHRWVASSKDAAVIIGWLLPHLKVKREQAVLFLELDGLKSQYRRGHQHNFQRQYEIMDEIASLKGKASRAKRSKPELCQSPELKRNRLGQFS